MNTIIQVAILGVLLGGVYAFDPDRRRKSSVRPMIPGASAGQWIRRRSMDGWPEAARETMQELRDGGEIQLWAQGGPYGRR